MSKIEYLSIDKFRFDLKWTPLSCVHKFVLSQAPAIAIERKASTKSIIQLNKTLEEIEQLVNRGPQQ